MDELAELRATIAQLSTRLTELESRAAAPAAAEPEAAVLGPVSRRGLLAAAAVGAGVIAGGVGRAAPASAAPGNAVILGAVNDGGGAITTINSATGSGSSPFAVINPNPNLNSIGIYGRLGEPSLLYTGAQFQRAAVMGDSHDQVGGAAFSANNPAIYAEADGFPAIFAKSQADGMFLSAQNQGVVVSTQRDSAVVASSTSAYGAELGGGKAALRLMPAATRGAPTRGKHDIGALHLDSAGALFLCVKTGNPGTWKQVATS